MKFKTLRWVSGNARGWTKKHIVENTTHAPNRTLCNVFLGQRRRTVSAPVPVNEVIRYDDSAICTRCKEKARSLNEKRIRATYSPTDFKTKMASVESLLMHSQIGQREKELLRKLLLSVFRHRAVHKVSYDSKLDTFYVMTRLDLHKAIPFTCKAIELFDDDRPS